MHDTQIYLNCLRNARAREKLGPIPSKTRPCIKMVSLYSDSLLSLYIVIPTVYLTNKEASTVLCSVVKHARSG